MNTLAVVFLIGCAIRGAMWFADDGFGGPVWDWIVRVSTLTWFVGAVMAVGVLTDISIAVTL